jgi:hypothetical protein
MVAAMMMAFDVVMAPAPLFEADDLDARFDLSGLRTRAHSKDCQPGA